MSSSTAACRRKLYFPDFSDQQLYLDAEVHLFFHGERLQPGDSSAQDQSMNVVGSLSKENNKKTS